MKNKNKIILGVLILLVVFSLSQKFKKYVIDNDYFVYLHAPCVAQDSTCFVYEEETYVKVYRKAYEIKKCIDGDCDPFVCREDEQDCMIIQCSQEELEGDEVCLDNKTE